MTQTTHTTDEYIARMRTALAMAKETYGARYREIPPFDSVEPLLDAIEALHAQSRAARALLIRAWNGPLPQQMRYQIGEFLDDPVGAQVTAEAAMPASVRAVLSEIANGPPEGMLASQIAAWAANLARGVLWGEVRAQPATLEEERLCSGCQRPKAVHPTRSCEGFF